MFLRKCEDYLFMQFVCGSRKFAFSFWVQHKPSFFFAAAKQYTKPLTAFLLYFFASGTARLFCVEAKTVEHQSLKPWRFAKTTGSSMFSVYLRCFEPHFFQLNSSSKEFFVFKTLNFNRKIMEFCFSRNVGNIFPPKIVFHNSVKWTKPVFN